MSNVWNRIIMMSFENPYEGYAGTDTKLTTQALTTIVSVVNVVLGAIVVLLGLMVALNTALDICFISMPITHHKIEEIIDRRKRDGKGSSVFVLLSKQAIDAYAEATETGQNALLLYLKKRSIYYVLLASAIYLIVVGWSPMVRFVANLLSGIFEQLAG